LSDLIDKRYLYNGKELHERLDLGWYDYGARWCDAGVGRWGAVDPAAEKYYGWSGYNYVMDSPVRQVDPDGERVVAHDKESRRNILNTLSEEEAKYVRFNKRGEIKLKRLNKSKSNSGNFTALRALANSEITYHFITSSSYESADIDKPQELVGEDKNGTKGVTLLPGADIDRSPDDDVYVYTSIFLSEEGQVKNIAHEGYGHAYFYELQQQGQNVNPNHQYEPTIVEVDPDAENPLDRYAIGRKDMNLRLVKQIEEREREAIQNYRSRKKQ